MSITSFVFLNFPFEHVTKFAVFSVTKLIYYSVLVKGKVFQKRRMSYPLNWVKAEKESKLSEQIFQKLIRETHSYIYTSLSNMLLWESESSFSSILNRNWMKGFESFPRYRVVWHFCWKNYEHIWYLSFFSNYLTQFFSTQNLQYLRQNVLFLTKNRWFFY